MARPLFTFIGIALLLYLGICLALYLGQRGMIYFPRAASTGTAAARMPLAVEGAELLVSVRERPGGRALLYFGGNAEDVSASLPQLSEVFPDRALYLMHYRGYGGSSGRPSEAALQSDALALFDEVHRRHPDITVIGRSLGSGIAVRLASLRPVTGVILVTPYDSLQEIAAGQFSWVPVRWLLADKYESVRYAPAVTAPTLLLAAERDEVIPRASTERLAASFNDGIARLQVIPGTGHNTISLSPAYSAALRALP